MSPPACLVITELDLSSLQTSLHGIFQRFRSIVEACHRLGYDIRIAAPIPADMTCDEREAFESTVATQIGMGWGIPVRVSALPTRRPPNLPRRLLRILGALRHSWSAGAFPLGGKAAQQALARCTHPALIVAHRLGTMSLALSLATPGRIVLDLDDIEHRKVGRSLGLSGSRFEYAVGWLSVLSLRWAERKACQSASTTLVCSEDDARYLRDEFDCEVIAIPNAVDVPAHPRTHSGRCIMLMVGIFTYGPNADAAEYFVRNVFPAIRARVPEAEAWFVGRGGESLETSLGATEGVRFLGFQQEITRFYEQARLAICPIRQGGGTRIKIIEAAAHCIPSVSTTLGAEGLSLDNGKSILIADDADRFADQCVQLLNNPERCAALGKAAYSVALSSYSRQGQLESLVSVLGI